MECKVKQMMDIMEDIAPSFLAEPWDNVGLLVGDHQKKVRRVLVTLDVTESVVQEAVEIGVDLIISHHPVIFKPIREITRHTGVGKILYPLIQNGISIYCAHTNLDKAKGGVDDVLARITGLKDIVPLTYEAESVAASEDTVRPAFGRLGSMQWRTTVADLANTLKKRLGSAKVSVIGDFDKDIEVVATCAGAGGEFLSKAKSMGADIYVTGELKYHEAQEVIVQGMTAITAGHYYTELPAMQELINRLQNRINDVQYNVELFLSEKQKDPYLIY